jgi:hemoglobin/transferrin/lactoferrin receptor protein
MTDRSSGGAGRLLAWWLLAPGAAWAQQPVPSPSPAAAVAESPRFLEAVTVSATLGPSAVGDTPGTVSVIGAEQIERRLLENTADLVTFEPGVYVESNLARIGANGFNIRGIGGNRVMTQVDGVETSEQFDFGPFNVHQFSLDLDALKSVEIVRSSGSSLYGSDALGGVVSFFTKDPADYLAGRRLHVAGKTTFDGRSDTSSGNVVIAGGGARTQASLFASFAEGREPENRGEVEAEGPARTVLNPQDRRDVQGVAKLVHRLSDGNVLRGAFELSHHDIRTEAFSARTVTVAGPSTTRVADLDSADTLGRWRASVDQDLSGRLGLDHVSWRLFAQRSRTEQVVDELRLTTAGGRVTTVDRHGTLEYEQDTFGGHLQGRKAVSAGGRALLLTFGAGHERDTFDMIRDRLDTNADTGAVVPPVGLILPGKYFPKSDVDETGVYVQGELAVGRLKLVPGVRYDRFAMDADAGDAVFALSLAPTPADFEADRVSARLGATLDVTPALTLHAQYAGGFRAPPYSAVNSGFTNPQGGYTSIPNTDLRPETSRNLEAGVRFAGRSVSAGVTGFRNRYDDFILQAERGVNPATGLLEFQYQNLAQARIRGVELQAEARLGETVRLRGAWAFVSGHDTSGPEETPLGTIAPDQGAVGIGYAPPGRRFGGDLVARLASGQPEEDAAEGAFLPEGYAVLDLTGWVRIARGLTLRGGVLNLTDRKYFEWPNVRGRLATDVLIDRYSSPGISGIVSLSAGW